MTKTIDLQQFCGEPGFRYALEKPFVKGGWRWATDGAILVRVPAEGEPDTNDGKAYPKNPGDVMRGWAEDLPWQPWPGEPQYVDAEIKCPKCKGEGFAHVKDCPRCDGTGEISCRTCGHEDDCPECDGEGTIGCGKCSKCDGGKTVLGPSHLELGDRFIRHKYAEAIRTLPDVRFALSKGADSPVWLKFAGGHGVVMPFLPGGTK